MTEDHAMETLRRRTAALHRIGRTNDELRAENERLCEELDRLGERVAYYRDSEIPALRSNADGWAARTERAEAEIRDREAVEQDVRARLADAERERDELRAKLDERKRQYLQRINDLRDEVEAHEAVTLASVRDAIHRDGDDADAIRETLGLRLARDNSNQRRCRVVSEWREVQP